MSNSKRPNNAMYHHQTGVVLVIGLVFLVLMTIIGTTAMQSSILNERMASNAGMHAQAFSAAEAALREGEKFFIASSCDSLKAKLANAPNPHDPGNWSQFTSTDANYKSGYVLTQVPKDDSEESKGAKDPDQCGGYYYITAKAEPPKGMEGMTVVLQTTLLRTL